VGLFDLPASFKPFTVAGVKQSRFIEPHDCEELDEIRVKYDNAEKLVDALGEIADGFRAFVLLDGKFVFGDLIEALIVRNDWRCDLTISTLSMSQDNVDSLANLINGGYLRHLNIIVSHYYFQTERRGIIPYLYATLDVDDHLQVAVASVHTKIAMIRTQCGKRIVIHGSANLRSSSNIEQIVIENSPGLYGFCYDVHASIVEKHKTINKAVRRTDLWSAVLAAGSDKPEQAQRLAGV